MRSTSFERRFRRSASRFARRASAGYVVFEASARGRSGFVALSPDGWRVSAEPNGPAITSLTDRDVATGWSTGRGQQPGQQIVIDLGRDALVTRVDLLVVDWQEVPAGFRIDVSRDGERWEPVLTVPRYWGPLFFSEHHAMLKVRHGRVQAVFPPTTTRWLRIVQTGTVSYRSWKARELFVYAPGPPPSDDVPPIEPLFQDRRPEFVYTGPWLAARLHTELGDRVRVPESNYFTNNNGHHLPDPRWLEPLRIEPGRVILLGQDADAAGVRAMLAARGVPVDTRVDGPYQLLTFKTTEKARLLDRAGWRATASVDTANAQRAIDGKAGTHWISGGPASPQDHLTVDLGRIREISGIRLTPGSQAAGPLALDLEGSDDGITWTALGPPTWAGALYWTGSELPAEQRRGLVVRIPGSTRADPPDPSLASVADALDRGRARVLRLTGTMTTPRPAPPGQPPGVITFSARFTPA